MPLRAEVIPYDVRLERATYEHGTGECHCVHIPYNSVGDHLMDDIMATVRRSRKKKTFNLLEILADWLEDLGDQRSAGLRWLVRRRAFPHSEFGWRWYRSPHATRPGAYLPLDRGCATRTSSSTVACSWYSLHSNAATAYLTAARDAVRQLGVTIGSPPTAARLAAYAAAYRAGRVS